MLISTVCCNLSQKGQKFLIAPREKTKRIFEENGLFFLREIVCYLKKCRNCRGSRVTVFAESMDGEVYFIESVKSKNVESFMLKNKILRELKAVNYSVYGSRRVPLKYFDRGKELPCSVNFSSLRVVPYENDIFADLKKEPFG